MTNDFPQNFDNGQNGASPLGDELVKEDLPEAEKKRKALAAKRTFWDVFAFILVLVALIVWEIVDLAL